MQTTATRENCEADGGWRMIGAFMKTLSNASARTGLLHLNLNVSDIRRSLRFYEGLGFTVVSESVERTDLGAGREPLHQVVLSLPQTRSLLALTQAASLVVSSGGMSHFGLIVGADDDVDELVARAEACGGSVGKRGRREAGGVSEVFAYVRDPDGYAIELSTQAILLARCAG